MLTEQKKAAITSCHAILTDCQNRLFNALTGDNLSSNMIGEIQTKLKWASEELERAKGGI